MENRIKLRIETSQYCSGKILNEQKIPLLKNRDYIVKNYKLDGDAPKQFIKAYFFTRDSGVKKSNPHSWHPFIAKTADKWYPHESVIEYMINRIGHELGIAMNEICLVKANKQIRFLSKYFLDKNENLIHGAEICGQHLGDMIMAKEIADHKKTSRELFTFEFIKEAIRSVFPNAFEPLTIDFVKMLAFDAIVGNNDRHFYNWGVIDTKKKTLKLPTFAPVYDSARGLLWNWQDNNLKNLLNTHLSGGKKLLNYIDEACPRVSIESNDKANHFELMDFLIRYNNDFREVIMDLSSFENEERVLEMLNNDFFSFYIPERRKLIAIILKMRFQKIRSLL